ncbi:MAG: TolC family protein [Gemmatimonadota bacterium]
MTAASSPITSQNRLTLAMLLDSVTATHPLVAASRARERAAEAIRSTAGVYGNPVFGFEVDNTPFPGAAPVPASSGLQRENMTTLTVPLEPIYQRGARVRQADAEVRAARADAAAERLRISRQASEAFYRAAIAQVGVDVLRDLTGWLDTVVAYNQSRVREGATAEADLIRTEVERDRAMAEETMQEAGLVRARAVLLSYLGDSPASVSSDEDAHLRIAAGDEPLPLPPNGLVNARSLPIGIALRTDTSSNSVRARGQLTLSDRPDVVAARERVTASTAGIATQNALLVRQLGATIGLKQSAGASTMIAGVSFPLPVFDQNRGEVARARAEGDIATYELADRKRTARAEVEGAREAAELLTARVALLSGATSENTQLSTQDTSRAIGILGRAEESRRIALGAYREGAVPLIQVLDAARAWGDARLTFYRTLYAQHESVLDLLAAQGIDLREAVSTMSPRPTTGDESPTRTPQ